MGYNGFIILIIVFLLSVVSAGILTPIIRRWKKNESSSKKSDKNNPEEIIYKEDDLTGFLEMLHESVVLHEQGRLVYASENFYRLTGYSNKDFEGKSFLLPITDRNSYQILSNQIMERRFEPLTVTGKKKNGMEFPMKIWGREGTFKNKAVQTIFILDLSEKRDDETALKTSENKYINLISKLRDGYMEFDLNGAVKGVNTSFMTMFGKDAVSAQNMTIDDILPDDEGKYSSRNIKEQVLIKGFSDEFKKEHKREDGRVFHFSIQMNLIKNAAGLKQGIYAIVKDISEIIKKEKELNRFRLLFDYSGDLIFIIDRATFGIIDFNRTAIEKLLYPGKKLFELKFYDILPEYDKKTFHDVMEQTGLDKTSFALETRLDSRIREPLPVEILFRSVVIDEHEYVIVSARDITKRKKMENELKHVKEDAEAANIITNEFLAGMSHELRTPLNAVIGFSDLLMDGHYGVLNDKQKEYVENIYGSGSNLLEIIDDILDLSKVESGRMTLEIEAVDIDELVRNSTVAIREIAEEKEIAVTVKVAKNISGMKIKADGMKLKQVMHNLLSNAAKFTPQLGSIEISSFKYADDLVVSVTDTGIGLDHSVKDQIFRPFFQVKSGYTGKTSGTGLGLTLVYRLVELHNGKVWAESEGLGKGSRFCFAVPILPV